MFRKLSAFMVALALGASSFAHFVYIVPAKDSKTVQVVFSDSLEPDENVAIEKVAGLKLYARTNEGKDVEVKHETIKHALTATIPAEALVIHGQITYGLLSKKDTPTTLLFYYPKAVVTGVTVLDTKLGDKCALEVVHRKVEGKVQFQLLAKGKPVADSEGSLLLPNGNKEKLKTDKDGFTAGFEGTGRFAVWLRMEETKAGVHAGQKYEQVKSYATYVVDIK